jgi:hypothetical protein
MSQPIALNNFVPGSSRKPRNARTVLLRMAADQDRADRIRALKRDHPEYTWQAIADRVGVSLRAAQSWQEKGGIEYENAKKLAELWDEDLDYIMRGRRADTPDLMGIVDDDDNRLARIEEKLDGGILEQQDLREQIAQQNRNLAAQTEILEGLTNLVGEIRELVAVLQDVRYVERAAAAAVRSLPEWPAPPELEPAPQEPQRATGTTGRARRQGRGRRP